MDKKIADIVINCLDETVQNYTDLTLKADENTIIFGENGALDSLALVALISEIESEISNKFNKDIILASEKAMSMKNSPFLNVKSLSKFIYEEMNESNGN
ncbi:Uncharacterised protein [Campylobacter sputorum subsp. bubulus]|uniref:Carrier domain-containing protein n=1 Tax=Campylobacter sputorum subsp. sputorum TaxID=32024 RepID=A0A381DJ64_9BACT|nr:hypothetical protein [Campylobacter sputorum]ASM35766.1 hypothetical protein CSPUT_1596 [Campylobacter sputorum aubsp. sputorum RM3237]KAB0581470.1 hypothetical protein F7P64_05995 [Campylobacter sputorum subsp. sputorum]QEL05956.1 hypothetical protein CSPT_1591 [Campylobacter sputorum subsp. sputorum]SUX09053.1 Uncharacterised protein [Campylobacter sputorum subsp. bubulus]SUX10744.1 Uncharacterised protein [Campylobacter sputorum subsp. sputorum]